MKPAHGWFAGSATLLFAALAASGCTESVGIGNDSQPQFCQIDIDCGEGQICVNGVCDGNDPSERSGHGECPTGRSATTACAIATTGQ